MHPLALESPQHRARLEGIAYAELALVPVARLIALATDPATHQVLTHGSTREALVGLALERQGLLPGPIVRDPSGKAEFIDATGQKWDVKSFHSDKPRSWGGFDADVSCAKISREVRCGEKVILDTGCLAPVDVAQLRSSVHEAGLDEGVLWCREPDVDRKVVALRHVVGSERELASLGAPAIVACPLTPRVAGQRDLVLWEPGMTSVIPCDLLSSRAQREAEGFPSPGVVAALIREYRKGSPMEHHPVRLLAPPLEDIEGYGKELASRLGTGVHIAPAPVWLHANGVVTIGETPADRDTSWVTFQRPQTQ